MSAIETVLAWFTRPNFAVPEHMTLDRLLSRGENLAISMRFGKSAQAKFLQHYLSIRGQGDETKEIEEILSTMTSLYEESNAMLSKVYGLVAYVLFERCKEGVELHVAMSDMFDTSFCMILQAMGAEKSNRDLNAAIAITTKDTTSRMSVLKWTRIKSTLSIISILTAVAVCDVGRVHYETAINKDPSVAEFIDVPYIPYAIGQVLAGHIPLIILVLFFFFAFQNNQKRTYLGLHRELLDKYYPPFILHRLFCGLTVFSGLTLLVSQIRCETIEALNMLHETSSTYEQHHISKMLNKLGEGDGGTMQLDTGLLTHELQLSLRIAGEGEAATIRTALEIINTEGQKSITETLVKLSSVMMAAIMFASLLLVMKVAAASFFLFQAALGL